MPGKQFARFGRSRGQIPFHNRGKTERRSRFKNRKVLGSIQGIQMGVQNKCRPPDRPLINHWNQLTTIFSTFSLTSWSHLPKMGWRILSLKTFWLRLPQPRSFCRFSPTHPAWRLTDPGATA